MQPRYHSRHSETGASDVLSRSHRVAMVGGKVGDVQSRAGGAAGGSGEA